MSAPIPPKFSALGAAALALEPGNFTPRERTPWGGTRISTNYKGIARQQIGESWEVSVEPQFPSHVTHDKRALSVWLDEDPFFFLGHSAHVGCALLVKLLDTDDRLSLQIHPHGDELFLGSDESGKPESWLVLDAEPGAGLYLGLADGVTEQDMRKAIRNTDVAWVESLLHFVPAARGDFFRIDAGTPHAIGAGLTLIEPQRVEPNKRGLTYRYYDWDRRYDARGTQEASGSPRALHLDEALAVTNWQAPRGQELVKQVHVRASMDVSAPLRVERLMGPTGALPSTLLDVASCTGSGESALGDETRLCSITVLEGDCSLENHAGASDLEVGHSAVVPARLVPETVIRGRRLHAVICAAP